MKTNAMRAVFKSKLFICLLGMVCWTSCCEEEDFLSVPSAESVCIKGVAQTSTGQPVQGVVVKLDYVVLTWPIGVTTLRHKAKATTDEKGNYTFYFEMRHDENNNSGKAGQFRFTIDLNGLDANHYVMPKDIRPDLEANILTYLCGDFERGKTYEDVIYIPRKQWVDVTIENNYLAKEDDKFVLSNYFEYGVKADFPMELYGVNGYARLQQPLTLTNDKVQHAQIPCAVGQMNHISVMCLKNGYGVYEDISPVEKLLVSAQKMPIRVITQPR